MDTNLRNTLALLLAVCTLLAWTGCDLILGEEDEIPAEERAAMTKFKQFDHKAVPTAPKEPEPANALAAGQEIEPPRKEPVPWPDTKSLWGLVAAGGGEVTRLDWDPQQKKFVEIKKAWLDNVNHLVLLGDRLYAANNTHIYQLDADLDTIGEVAVNGLEVLASDGKTLYATGDHSLLSFDKELKSLGRVPLDCGQPKNAHGLLFYKNTAFVLDNRVMPVCVFRVDISNPAELKIKDKIQADGVNAHLNFQWIDPKAKQWAIVRKTGGKKGTKQSVQVYPLMKGKKKRFAQQTYSALETGKKRIAKGEQVIGALPGPPNLVVVQDKKGLHHLAKVTANPKKLAFNKQLSLSRSVDLPPGPIARTGKCLFVEAYENIPKKHPLQDECDKLRKSIPEIPTAQAAGQDIKATKMIDERMNKIKDVTLAKCENVPQSDAPPKRVLEVYGLVDGRPKLIKKQDIQKQHSSLRVMLPFGPKRKACLK